MKKYGFSIKSVNGGRNTAYDRTKKKYVKIRGKKNEKNKKRRNA